MGNTESKTDYFKENGLPTKQQLRDLNASLQPGDVRPAAVEGAAGGADTERPEREPIDAVRRKIGCLREFVLPERYESLTGRLDHRTRYLVMCLEDIYYPHNASAVIRSSEAFGIQELHAVEHTVRFAPNKHIVRGTDQWLDIRKWTDTPALVGHLRERGYRIVATAPPRPTEEVDGRRVNFTPSTFDVQAGPFALFMGTEKSGISDWLSDQADAIVSIPMVGFAESLNISVSAAIVAQRLAERVRDPRNAIAWQLDDEDRDRLLLRWLCHSVRDWRQILQRSGG